MLPIFRVLPVLVLVNSAFAEKLQAPRIEMPVPIIDSPQYQGKALKRFDAGFAPPTSNHTNYPFSSLSQYSYWDDDENKVEWCSALTWLHFDWFSTDGSLKKLSPQLSEPDGARVIRDAAGVAIQWQFALFVIDIKKSDKGWVLAQWRAEDTEQVSHRPLRIPIAGRKCYCLFEMEEQAFDPARLFRHVIYRQTYENGQIVTLHTITEDSATESKTTLETYTRKGTSPEVLVGRTVRSSTRIPDSRKFIETTRKQRFAPDGVAQPLMKKSTVWELDQKGVRHYVKEAPVEENETVGL